MLWYLKIGFKVAGDSLLIHEFAYSLFIGLCSVTSNMTGCSHLYHWIKLIHCCAPQRDVEIEKYHFWRRIFPFSNIQNPWYTPRGNAKTPTGAAFFHSRPHQAGNDHFHIIGFRITLENFPTEFFMKTLIFVSRIQNGSRSERLLGAEAKSSHERSRFAGLFQAENS